MHQCTYLHALLQQSPAKVYKDTSSPISQKSALSGLLISPRELVSSDKTSVHFSASFSSFLCLLFEIKLPVLSILLSQSKGFFFFLLPFHSPRTFFCFVLSSSVCPQTSNPPPVSMPLPFFFLSIRGYPHPSKVTLWAFSSLSS